MVRLKLAINSAFTNFHLLIKYVSYKVVEPYVYSLDSNVTERRCVNKVNNMYPVVFLPR